MDTWSIPSQIGVSLEVKSFVVDTIFALYSTKYRFRSLDFDDDCRFGVLLRRTFWNRFCGQFVVPSMRRGRASKLHHITATLTIDVRVFHRRSEIFSHDTTPSGAKPGSRAHPTRTPALEALLTGPSSSQNCKIIRAPLPNFTFPGSRSSSRLKCPKPAKHPNPV